MEILFTVVPASWLLTATLFISFLCSILYYLTSNNSNKTSHKLPPIPPRLPVIGNLHQLLGKPRHQALWQLSQQYGPIMRLHLGSKPFLIISSPAMAKQVLKTHDHAFCSRPMSTTSKRLTFNYSDVAFSPQSEHRRDMRKVLMSEFLGPKRSRLFNRVLVTETENIIRFLDSRLSNGSVNMNKLLLATVKGVVCRVALGDNYRQQPVNGPSWEVMVSDFIEALGGSVGDFFPWPIAGFINEFSGSSRKLEKSFTNIDAYIETVIDDIKKEKIGEVSDGDKNFVRALLDLSAKDTTSGYRLTELDIKALIMDILIGGVDTTAVTMIWAMSEIARNVRVMQKLQTEIRNYTGKIERVDEMDITKMTYLKMVIKETLRMHPPVPLLIPHECISRCQVGGYNVFPGTTVLINAWGLGRDPRVWGENATEFYPERFEKFEVDFDMVPFGGGRRSCPAMSTAPTTIEFVIANLLYWFDWEVPDGVSNEELSMEEEGTLVLRRKVPLCLLPTKYNRKD